MTGSLLALGVLNVSSTGCCCGVWTENFWFDKKERELFIRDLPIDFVNGKAEGLRTDAFRRRLQNAECPFGLVLPMDVTWPRVPEDVAMLVEPLTFLKFLAVVYGYLPLLPVAVVLVDCLIHRGSRHLWILLWLGVLLSVNEAVVKKIVAEPRPGSMMELRGQNGLLEGSCVETCGMPSSHSAISMGWFLLSVLDAMSRTNLRRDQIDLRTFGGDPLVAEQRKWGAFIKNFCSTPWIERTDLSARECISIVVYWFLIMVPVPFMRVVLRDHTESQVVAGSCLGVALAMVWWRGLRVLESRYHTSFRGHQSARSQPPRPSSEVEMGVP